MYSQSRIMYYSFCELVNEKVEVPQLANGQRPTNTVIHSHDEAIISY